MSREILFRGKRVDNGEWVEGDLVRLEFEGFLHSLIIKPDKCSVVDSEYCLSFKENEVFTVDPETVSQLIDTIGEIKVFNGDIFGFKGSEYTYFIRVEDSFQAMCYHCNPKYYDEFLKQHMRWGHFYRIKELGYEDRFYLIGNVYDNPELIRKEAQNV